MGLDQCGVARKEGQKDKDLMYWRKNSGLAGWMQDLYESKGGKGRFNGVEMSLSKEDLLKLKEDYQSLEESSGFFWCNVNGTDNKDTARFIELALVALEEGYEVFYSSSW